MKPITLQDTCIESLQEILTTLQALEPPPVIGTHEYFNDISQYRIQYERIKDLMRKAEVVALMTIPPEVKAVLDQIENRHCSLLLLNR